MSEKQIVSASAVKEQAGYAEDDGQSHYGWWLYAATDTIEQLQQQVEQLQKENNQLRAQLRISLPYTNHPDRV